MIPFLPQTLPATESMQVCMLSMFLMQKYLNVLILHADKRDADIGEAKYIAAMRESGNPDFALAGEGDITDTARQAINLEVDGASCAELTVRRLKSSF
ncbi:MAG: hypothetical protein ACU84Q_14860 [Gammaproteobacteria bacterium]